MTRDINEAQRAWLATELDAWRAQGLISDDQARAVLSLYGTEAEAADRRQSRAIGVLQFLAALLAGLGVLLLIGYNWQELPSTVKVALIFASVAGAHGLGFWLRGRKGGAEGVSDVAFFFGCLLYGAGIALIGQIFHVPSTDAGAFWWWAVGVLPFALALDATAFHLLYAGLLAVWAGYEVFGFRSLGAWLFGRWPGVPNGAYSLLALAAPGLAWCYRNRNVRTLALYVLLVAWWVVLQPFAWRFDNDPIPFLGAVGGLLLLAAELHRPGDAMAIPYRYYGAGLTGVALVPLSFFRYYRGPWNGPVDVLGTLAGPVFALAIGVVLAAGVALWRGREAAGDPGAPAWPARLAALVRAAWVPAALIALFVGVSFWHAVSGGDGFLPAIGANVAMLALAFWLMRVGLREDRGQPFSAGVGYFLLWALIRYFDLFGDFGGMLGAALMFFLCGAALFGVATYWRRRKEVTLA